jgi:hypothetical protein
MLRIPHCLDNRLTVNCEIVTVRFLYSGYAVTSIISDYEYELLSHIIFHLVES